MTLIICFNCGCSTADGDWNGSYNKINGVYFICSSAPNVTTRYFKARLSCLYPYWEGEYQTQSTRLLQKRTPGKGKKKKMKKERRRKTPRSWVLWLQCNTQYQPACGLKIYLHWERSGQSNITDGGGPEKRLHTPLGTCTYMYSPPWLSLPLLPLDKIFDAHPYLGIFAPP